MKPLLLSIIVFFVFTNGYQLESLLFEDKRDGKTYELIKVNDLFWFGQNLDFGTEKSVYYSEDSLTNEGCAQFYNVEDAKKVCPENWRLPTKKEVKRLIKYAKKNDTNVLELLNITLCGRIDYGKSAKLGQQTTFWLDEPLENGDISHWHIFDEKVELHKHNVVNAARQFPVRCVCGELN